MPSSELAETNVCRKSRGAQSLPNPALPQTSWNIFRKCLAPSGVPVAAVNTLPAACERDPAASCSAAWSTCHSLSARQPSAPGRHAAGPRRLRVSSLPVRAQHRDRRTIAVQVDALLPATRPGLHEARASHTAYNDVGVHQVGRAPRILQLRVPLQCRRCLPSAHGAPCGRRGCCHGPWAPFPRAGACTGGSRLWLPGLRLAFQKGHLAAKAWWAQLGSNQ